MPEHTFRYLRNELQDAGIAPRHVRRIVSELEDHLEDLRDEARMLGQTAEEASRYAICRIGDQKAIAERMLDAPELRTWIYRYPRVARLYLPVAYVLLLPAAPLIAGFANPGIVFRWGAALMLSAAVTAAMFLSMQLAIALT